MKLKFALLLICSIIIPFTLSGQKQDNKITVTGVVLDDKGSPLKGITIYVDNFKSSAITNKKGAYKVKVKPTTKTIAAFSLHYGGQIIDLENKTKINFTLTGEPLPDGIVLKDPDDEVDIGYQKASKESLTTSVGEVNMEEASKSHYRNIYEMIRGKVPGVVVEGTNVYIRGASSVNGSNAALFVVDGSPVNSSSIAYISPNEVASISVLKGSSAAIYGTRGANGVILINTKSGRDR